MSDRLELVDVSIRTVGVSKVFLLDRDKQILAHLTSFDWDFRPGDVRIICGEEVLAVRQIGSGSHEGIAVVALGPIASWGEVVAYIRKIEAGGKPILIEK